MSDLPENAPSPAEDAPPRPVLYIPLWVGLAGALGALLVGLLIFSRIAEPLANLIFVTRPEIPLPLGAVELEAVEDPLTSDGEWRYGVDMDPCQVAVFYQTEGESTCNYVPFTCELDADGRPYNRYAGVQTNVATCSGSRGQGVNRYTWEVLIGSSGDAYITTFRVYLYRERR